MIGSVMFEGMAKTADEAVKLIETGKVEWEPCHDHSSVGPMAGVIAPSFLVYEVVDKNMGLKALFGIERRPRQSSAHGCV